MGLQWALAHPVPTALCTRRGGGQWGLGPAGRPHLPAAQIGWVSASQEPWVSRVSWVDSHPHPVGWAGLSTGKLRLWGPGGGGAPGSPNPRDPLVHGEAQLTARPHLLLLMDYWAGPSPSVRRLSFFCVKEAVMEPTPRPGAELTCRAPGWGCAVVDMPAHCWH